MTSRFRAHATAAVLLASLGAAFVATPASAHVTMVPHHHDAREILQRFDLLGAPAVGREVLFRVHGMAQGQATVDVPGVMNDWRLTEVQPGVYEGRYIVAPRDNPGAFSAATATVLAGGQRAQARIAAPSVALDGNAFPSAQPQPPVVVVRPQDRHDEHRDDRDARGRRDNRNPEIVSVSPAHGERISERGFARISARFGDDRSGVDTGSVRLRVDGRDVTGRSRIDGDSIDYRADLAPGRHVAEVTVRDRAGNLTRRSWTFDVVDTHPGHGHGYGHDEGRRW